MPNPSAGVYKQLAYKAEATYGTLPAAASAQQLRRLSSNLELSKDTYQSNEIRPDLQVADFRHGVRRVKGTISGDLSCKTFADFFAAAVKKVFAAGAVVSGASITIAGAGPYTLTRAAGSYLTDGIKVGDVIRLSVGVFNVANINRNLYVTAVTATVVTVITFNAAALVAEGPIAGSTMTVQGKKTFIPSTGQVENSFAIEHYFSDLVQSEVFTGCKVDKISVNLPPTGMANIAIEFVGQNMTPGSAQYFTSPTAITTTGALAAVNGIARINGTQVASITGLSLSLDPTYTGDPVVGSNTVPYQFPGFINVTGQATLQFTDVTLRDAFINETEIDMYGVFTADNTATSDFLAFSMPRIKLLGATKNDGTGSLILTVPFRALLNKNGGAGTATELTTISIQDSAA